MKELIENAEFIPAVNQIEFHPRLVQEDLMKYCKEYNIQLEAWSPLMRVLVFEITKEDIRQIEKLNDGFRIGMNPNEVYGHPEIIRD